MTSSITSIFAPNGIVPLPEKATGIIHDYLYFFHTFCDLTDKDVLKHYVAPEALKNAIAIAKQIYEKLRPTYKNAFGYIFPPDAEVLAYAMQRIRAEKDMEVCEIACGDGKNTLLLASAGAKKVIFNDLVEEELVHLKNFLKLQDSHLQNQCEIITGNCLDLLKMKPTLKGRMGLVLCRNFLHFLRTQEQVQFLAMVQQLLAPDGQAIFVVNSIYIQGSEVGIPLEDSTKASYSVFNCELYEGNLNPTTLCTPQWIPCEENLVSSTSKEMLYLYEKSYRTQNKWKKDTTQWKKVDKQFQEKIKQAFNTQKLKLQNVKDGTVRVTSTKVWLYNFTNLSHLFRSNGFDVISEFMVDADGHLVNHFSNRFARARGIGVIVTKKQ